MIEPKSITYRVAAPGIGVIRVASFPGAVGLSFARALDGAIATLKRENCSRLVIDLRGNVGGGLEYRFTPHIGIFSDAGYEIVDGPKNNFMQVNFGLKYAF